MRLTSLVVLLCSCLVAQAPRRAVLPKEAVDFDPARHDVRAIVVKLAEAAPGRPAAALHDAAVRAALGARVVRPYFAGLERELAELRARVLAATPPGEQPPADLSLYHLVETSGPDDARAALAALNACAEVELAAPRPKPCPPPGDVPPVTPDFVPYQAYRDPAPDGIDAFAIQQLTGAMGTGVTVLEIEWGWWFDHEDLSKLRPGSLVGPPGVVEAYNWHGLGVIGILAADADRWGVSGLVPDIDVLVASSYPATGYNVAAAVVLGLTRLRAGDVILIAAQIESPLGLVPIEWNQPDFDAIQNATRLGVAVLETGANGAVDLDDRRLRRAFDLSFRDSGAIIVGASAGRLRERAWFSSFGSRIDANGWGLDVITTGYGDLFGPNQDRRQTYTMAFSGTSSATPMVTAAVVALRGAANAQLAPADANSLDWRAIRALLRAHGTPMQGDARIGLRPDMRRLFRAAGLERGLRLRSRARLGQMVEIEISPEHARTGEGWLLLAARAPANLPLSAPFLGNGCDRLLLDPATTQALAEGVFTAHTTVLPLPVPTEPALHDQRFYLQAVRVRADGTACATNSVLLLIEP